MKIDVYLKWTATTVLILGTAVNTALPQLFLLGPLILALGGVLWLVVSIMWREWALIVTNAVMMAVGIVGLAYYYLS